MSAAVFAPGSSALITGAASGIGLAIAKLCRAKGMKVLLVDRNTTALETAKAEVSGPTPTDEVTTWALDVSQPAAWSALKDHVASTLGTVELLVLNAGLMSNGTWGDADYFRNTLETNLFGVINGINTFLPLVQAQKSRPTSIVITGSKQGITNPPGNAAYNASKAAVKTLAEHLSWDLRDSPTSVHLLVPGWVWTGLVQTAAGRTEKPAGAWNPEQVADYLYEKMAEKQFYIVCPDNDVSEELDKKRMLWSVGDLVQRRPPLSRWREEWKEEAADAIAKTQV